MGPFFDMFSCFCFDQTHFTLGLTDLNDFLLESLRPNDHLVKAVGTAKYENEQREGEVQVRLDRKKAFNQRKLFIVSYEPLKKVQNTLEAVRFQWASSKS